MKNLIALSLMALGVSALAGTTDSDTDVLVVGAGPAGIGAAALAAQRNVDVRDLPSEDVKRTLRALGAIVPTRPSPPRQ